MKMTETSLRPVARTGSAPSDGVPSRSGIARSLAGRTPGDNRMGMETTQYEDRPLEDRLAALEARVQMLEDQLAVQQLLNRWGPAVDIGDSAAAAALWADDGVLESEISYLGGPAAVAAMVGSEGQQSLIRQGCAHIQAFPLINVEGDRATAIGYSRVYLHREDGSYEVW